MTDRPEFPLYKGVGWFLTLASLVGFLLILAFKPNRYGQLFDPVFLVTETYSVLLLAVAVLSWLSTRIEKIRFIHPTIAILFTSASFFDEPNASLWILYFSFAVALLLQYGYLKRKPVLKLFILGVFLISGSIIGGFINGYPLANALMPAFVIPAYLLGMYWVFRSRLRKFMLKKPVLNLKAIGLSRSEAQAIEKVLLMGLSVKEASDRMNCSPSTVNNHLAKAYDKLGTDHTQAAAVRHLSDFLVVWKD